jgi:hypothetical protein
MAYSYAKGLTYLALRKHNPKGRGKQAMPHKDLLTRPYKCIFKCPRGEMHCFANCIFLGQGVDNQYFSNASGVTESLQKHISSILGREVLNNRPNGGQTRLCKSTPSQKTNTALQQPTHGPRGRQTIHCNCTNNVHPCCLPFLKQGGMQHSEWHPGCTGCISF